MERDNQTLSDLIDLGAASEATKGPWGDFRDEYLTQPMTGLSND